MNTASMNWKPALVALAVALGPALVACGDKGDADKDKKSSKDDDDDDKDTKKKSKKSASPSSAPTGGPTGLPLTANPPATVATPPDASPTATGAKPTTPVTDPNQQTYADVANKIADDCSNASVLMTSAPESVGADYPWTWTRQALLANQQFKVVAGPPAAHGEVSFEVHQASSKFQNAWVLVGKCSNGSTCNKLAAMNKAIVKGSVSQPVCGPLPMDLSPATMKKPVLRELGDAQNTLPQKTEIVGQCARLHACTIAMDPTANAGATIGLDCQKGPTKFKTDCATKYPCAEVMKCLE